MPIIERKGDTLKVNLTIPILVWTWLFLVLAVALDSQTLMWLGVAPLLLWAGFMVFLWVFAACLVGVAYLSGHEVELKYKGRVKRVRRK